MNRQANTDSGALRPQERTFIEQLFRTYNKLMYSVVGKCVEHQDEQEEIIQESLLQFCIHVETIRMLPEHALVNYVAQTIRHTAINYLKHKQVVQKYLIPLCDEIENTLGIQDQYFADEELDEEYRKFRKLWISLNDEERTLLYQKYVFHQSYTELAEKRQCSEESLRMKVHRLKKRCIQAVRDAQEEES